MDNIDIEKFSINAVENSMSGCLHPVLQKNSTLPSWDGEIYIYRSSSKKKEDMIGRVPVQVKGTANDDFSQDEIKYSVSRSDLENYFNDGGALYFVIYVRESGNAKIYYNALTPDKLHEILGETPKQQKTRTITFNTFPEKSEDKINLLKKINSECEDLLPALEKAKENAQQIIGIDRLQKKTTKQKRIKLKDLKKEYKSKKQELDNRLNTQGTIGYSKEELIIYQKLPKFWKIFADSKAIPNLLLYIFWCSLIIAFKPIILKNILLSIGCILGFIFVNYIYLAYVANLFKTVWKKSANFLDCLGYTVATWGVLISIVIFIGTYKGMLSLWNITVFDFSNVFVFPFYVAIISAVIQIITISLYNCSWGKFAKLFSDDARNNLIVESILHKIPQEYWTETCIQKLINITTKNKIEFLSDALEIFESTKTDDTDTPENIEITYDESKQSYDNEKKIEYYQQPTDLKSTFADAYHNMGIAYSNKGNFAKAIKCYNKAIKKNPNNAEVYISFGDAYLGKGNYDNAIGYYEKAIEFFPNEAAIYNNLGIAYDEKGNFDEAIKCYEKVIKLNPDDAAAYNNLGLVYYTKSNSEKAIVYFEKAIELNPNYADAYNNMGIAYCGKADFDKGIKCYEKAIKLNPDARTYNNMGIAYDAIKLPDAAIICYEKASMMVNKGK